MTISGGNIKFHLNTERVVEILVLFIFFVTKLNMTNALYSASTLCSIEQWRENLEKS